jgi:hypothetical protein
VIRRAVLYLATPDDARAEERGRAIEGEDRGRLLGDRVEVDAAALLVPRDVVAVDHGPDALPLLDERLDERPREPPLEDDELVLRPVRGADRVEIDARDRARHALRDPVDRHARMLHCAKITPLITPD